MVPIASSPNSHFWEQSTEVSAAGGKCDQMRRNSLVLSRDFSVPVSLCFWTVAGTNGQTVRLRWAARWRLCTLHLDLSLSLSCVRRHSSGRRSWHPVSGAVGGPDMASKSVAPQRNRGLRHTSAGGEQTPS
jgi:hypothetical protein